MDELSHGMRKLLHARSQIECPSCRREAERLFKHAMLTQQEKLETRAMVRSCRALYMQHLHSTAVDGWTRSFLKNIATWDCERFIQQPVPVASTEGMNVESWALGPGHGISLGGSTRKARKNRENFIPNVKRTRVHTYIDVTDMVFKIGKARFDIIERKKAEMFEKSLVHRAMKELASIRLVSDTHLLLDVYDFTDPERVQFGTLAWTGCRGRGVVVRQLNPNYIIDVVGSLANLFNYVHELVTRRESERNRGFLQDVLRDATEGVLNAEPLPQDEDTSLHVARVLATRCQLCMDILMQTKREANQTNRMIRAVQSSLAYNRGSGRISMDAEAEFIWHMCACHVKSAAAGTAQMDEDGLRRVIVSTYRLITQWISCRKFSSLSTLQGACASTAPRTSMSTGDPYRECSAP